MKIARAEFVTSALLPAHYPKGGRPEIAFVGRSNVGKSTLLNILLNKKGLAKTSKTPGKTQTVNFFDVNGKVYFVDLPGYGYAKVGKGLQEKWAQSITTYLESRKTLRLVAQLVDTRHDASNLDHQMLDLLESIEVPTVVVATKFDKVRTADRDRVLQDLRKSLELDDEALIIPFSSLTKEGLRPLWNVIDDVLR